ncbi:MAG: hypothetical protein ACKVT1_10905 [Dehalococcoidia bacterium]
MGWVLSPHTGGDKVSAAVQARTERAILEHAERNYSGLFTRIAVRFKGQFCYIDAFTEPAPPSPAMLHLVHETAAEYLARLRETPTHLVRLRYFRGRDQWSLAFYAYSHERYEPCTFPSGDWFGSAEDAFDVGAVYLREG